MLLIAAASHARVHVDMCLPRVKDRALIAKPSKQKKMLLRCLLRWFRRAEMEAGGYEPSGLTENGKKSLLII